VKRQNGLNKKQVTGVQPEMGLYLRIMFISLNSTPQVPKLLSGLSSVDRRVNNLSQIGIEAYEAGTKQPICAKI
jgi:hypothetical protein